MMIVSKATGYVNKIDIFVSLAINVTFSQSAYSTKEDDGFLQFALLFSNPSAFDISITVTTSDLAATGYICALTISS